MNMSWWPFRLSSSRDSFPRMSWQAVVGVIFTASGLVLFGMALFMEVEGRDAGRSADAPLAYGAVNLAEQPEPHLTKSPLPADRDQLEDLKRLFELARASGVRIGQVDHAWVDGPERDLRLHMVTLRLNEPYPDLRRFLGRLSEVIPHAGIHDLRIERRNVAAVELDTTLQLLMLYRATAQSNNAD